MVAITGAWEEVAAESSWRAETAEEGEAVTRPRPVESEAVVVAAAVVIVAMEAVETAAAMISAYGSRPNSKGKARSDRVASG